MLSEYITAQKRCQHLCIQFFHAACIGRIGKAQATDMTGYGPSRATSRELAFLPWNSAILLIRGSDRRLPDLPALRSSFV
ncbi:MAG: hypothetical protein AB7O39_06695 [Flavobacteriaceae bacterium]